MEELFRGRFVRVLLDEASGHEIVDKKRRETVHMLVYVKDLDRVIFVEQHRPAMGKRITEVPAGHIEAGMSPEETVIKELFEEIGATVEPSQISYPNGNTFLASSPGCLTEKKLMAFVEITSDQLRPGVVFGNAAEGEKTRRLQVKTASLESLEYEDLATWGLVQWFLHTRAEARLRETPSQNLPAFTPLC